jgi:hypothetical protein
MRLQLTILGACAGLLGCNPDPGETEQVVDYRAGTDGATSGERGNVKISEVLWTGSASARGERDQSDVFVEFRNEGAFPINMSGWHLILEGSVQRTWRIPDSDLVIPVGKHVFFAAKDDGCFPNADGYIEGLELPDGDPFRLTLKDADERLMEPVGDKYQPPMAGAWDTVRVRSMERVEIMFGGYGTEPNSWHHYTDAPVDVPNNDRMAAGCRSYTYASPGRPNSPDYSGAFASGNLE